MSRGLAYYNEIDPYAAAWLRNLIAEGHIAFGDVDERDIRLVTPADLKPYTQCHFFAGIGIWSAALRGVGWPDEHQVWTGSCPCQPFSAAGKRKGVEDERHLWPWWYELIRSCRPVRVFGEQVASKDGLAWLDIVQADLESAGYASGAVDLCAAGVGAPHRRQRLWFVAYPHGGDPGTEGLQRSGKHGFVAEDGRALRLAHANEGQRRWLSDSEECEFDREMSRWFKGNGKSESSGDAGELGHPNESRSQGRRIDRNGSGERFIGPPGVVGGFWRDAEFIPCTDGKARPVEAGTFPLAYGDFARVGRLRAYGNAIVRPTAEAFVVAAEEVIAETAVQW